MKPTVRPNETADSANITQQIREMGDWRGETLAHVRKLIKEADPEILEEIKWRKPSNPDGVPVWSHNGIICTGEAHTAHVRLTFANGASLKDPGKIFNSGFDGNVLRAIVLREGDKIDDSGFKQLIRHAVAANSAVRPRRAAKKT